MQAVGPNILVKIEKKHDDKIVVGGKELYFDPLYRPTWNLRIHGIVEALPNVPPTNFDGFLIDPILEIGDKVYFRHVNTDSDATTVASSFGNEYESMLKRIPYDDVFCVVRDGEIIPVGGWILGEPELVGEGEIELIDDGRGNLKKVKLTYLNRALNIVEPYSEEFDVRTARVKYRSKFIDSNDEIEVGDLVYGVNINYLNVIEGQDFYCFKEETVMGKFV